jgi:predicted RNA-binding Zn ribbon-like protein
MSGMEEFRFAYGAPWLDLLATRRMRRRPPEVEYLTDPAALRAWLRREGLEPATAPDHADLVAAQHLREALYLIARATLDDQRAPDDAVATVNEALQHDAPPRVTTAPDGIDARRPGSAAQALAWIAREAVTQLTGPAVERLRPCGEETCGGIFLDESGRRRWCSDSTCGSRARVRAHRARARQPESAR